MSDPGDPRMHRRAFLCTVCVFGIVLYKWLGLISLYYTHGGFDPSNWQ